MAHPEDGHGEDQRLASAMIDCYFGGARRGSQLVKHQIDSYNDFVSRKLEQVGLGVL